MSTRYSDQSGAGFTYSMPCADTDTVSAPARTTCAGTFAGNDAALVPTADGVQIAIGVAHRFKRMGLPKRLVISDGQGAEFKLLLDVKKAERDTWPGAIDAAKAEAE